MIEKTIGINFLPSFLARETFFQSCCITVSIFVHALILYSFPSSNDLETLHFSLEDSESISIKVRLANLQKRITKPQPVLKKETIRSLKTKKVIREEKEVLVKGAKKAVATNTGKNSELAKYMSHVRRTINHLKVYPRAAKRMRHQGQLQVEILIDESGQIITYDLIKKSHSLFLNKATKDIFNKVKNFGARPKGIAEGPLKVVVPITYKIL